MINEQSTVEKKEFNTSWMWAISTVILYTFSTITLIKGLKEGASIGMNVAGGAAINTNLLFWLGLSGGIVTQLIETAGLLQWREMSSELKFIIWDLLIIDFLAIFVAIGGHVNVIWMINNSGGDLASMFIHVVGLAFQITLAFLGSYGAELSLRMYLETKGITVHDLFLRKEKKNKISRSSAVRNRRTTNEPIPVSVIKQRKTRHSFPHSGIPSTSVSIVSYDKYELWSPKTNYKWVYLANNQFIQMPIDASKPPALPKQAATAQS